MVRDGLPSSREAMEDKSPGRRGEQFDWFTADQAVGVRLLIAIDLILNG